MNNKKNVLNFFAITAFVIPGIFASNAVAADTPSATCANDLEDMAAFLPINDSGAAAARQHHGAAINAALKLARKDAAAVTDRASCDATLSTYLRAWRPGHLSLGPWPRNMAAPAASSSPEKTEAGQEATQAAADPFLSTMKVLSKTTLLLTLPTFRDSYRADIESLLKKNRSALEEHPNWIVDVRSNNGGSDSSYSPLLPWLTSGGFAVQNAEWLSTPENLHAQETICSVTGDKASCDEFLAPVIDALRDTPAGHYTLAKGATAISYGVAVNLEKHRPKHIAVLIDRACGSSCEQFLLTVRQSQSVKLLGRPSSGQLDVSNLRPHLLPSGNRALLYATSRSSRLPDMPIDQIGVQPDILLPRTADAAATDNEVRRVQRWLEGGSLE
ncbi:S41 family peptidase [Undibacterium sp.]|uniref:S41 family peptidase n=1 Tax=Undibacterium sp. TaxID=1914977 RepID=UPI00374D6FEA